MYLATTLSLSAAAPALWALIALSELLGKR